VVKDIKQTVPEILLRLARLLGTEVNNRRLDIPEQFGKGYCIGFIFNEHIRMLISNYVLHHDIAVANPEIDDTKRMIFFKFQHIFRETEARQPDVIPSVLIGTSRVNTDEVISIHSNTATILIEVDAGYLNGLFEHPAKSPVLQSLFRNMQPLLFEQIIYPPLQKLVDEILMEPVDETFELFFFRLKAEELICRLLMELDKRDEQRLYPLNSQDIETIYKVRERILECLDVPPVIRDLGVNANMSPSKLKRLFKQVFGDSIFSYYQGFRIKEAARLLKDERMSVSEVGYQMGFTNLSHFSRVFKEHTGMRPKQYSKCSS